MKESIMKKIILTIAIYQLHLHLSRYDLNILSFAIYSRTVFGSAILPDAIGQQVKGLLWQAL